MTPTLTEAAKLALELKRLLDVHGSLSMGAKQIIEPVIDRMAALAAQEALPAVGESERANRVGDLRNAMWLDPRCASHAACQSLVFKQEHQTAVENERQQFQRETLRTSELSALLQRWVDCHEAEHGPGPWARSCDVCALVGESNALLSKPINAPQPVPSPEQAQQSVQPGEYHAWCGDIADWEDKALAEAVIEVKRDLSAMVEAIQMRATSPAPGAAPPVQLDPHAHWIPSADGLSRRNPAPDASAPLMPNSVTVKLTAQASAPSVPTQELTDERIEVIVRKCGGTWNGSVWMFEDADLHPFVRTCIEAAIRNEGAAKS